MGPPAFRRHRCGRCETSRGPGELAGLDQARSGGQYPSVGPAARHSTAAGAYAGFSARGTAAAATAGARSHPVVLALEDMHWADPTTLDLLRNIAERAAQAPLFVLMTARPEFRPQWDMRPHHATISLAPLDRHHVQHMVGEIADCRALPKEVIDGVT